MDSLGDLQASSKIATDGNVEVLVLLTALGVLGAHFGVLLVGVEKCDRESMASHALPVNKDYEVFYPVFANCMGNRPRRRFWYCVSLSSISAMISARYFFTCSIWSCSMSAIAPSSV